MREREHSRVRRRQVAGAFLLQKRGQVEGGPPQLQGHLEEGSKEEGGRDQGGTRAGGAGRRLRGTRVPVREGHDHRGLLAPARGRTGRTGRFRADGEDHGGRILCLCRACERAPRGQEGRRAQRRDDPRLAGQAFASMWVETSAFARGRCSGNSGRRAARPRRCRPHRRRPECRGKVKIAHILCKDPYFVHQYTTSCMD